MIFDTLSDFSTIAGVGVIVVDENGEKKFSTSVHDKAEQILNYLINILDSKEHCRVVTINCCYQSFRFNGRYTFMDPMGFVWVVSPIVREGKPLFYSLAGPMLMTSYEDYIEFDIEHSVSEYDKDFVELQLKNVPVIEPEKVPSILEQLCLNAYYLGDGTYDTHGTTFSNKKSIEDIPAGIRLKEYFESYNDVQMSAEKAKIIEEEQKLIEALDSHDIQPARILLNAILGQILFHSGKNMEFIKSRILELVVLLSMAAVRDGADKDVIGKMKQDAYAEIDDQETFEDIIIWLNHVLDRFKNHIFVDPSSKYASIIRNTVNYILKNYGEKITLEDVAKKAFLSTTYFSRLFKEETGYSFTNYLNRVRIAQSKELLQDSSLSIAEISATVGFEDQSYFTKVFKRFEGVSPNKFRTTANS